MNKWTAREWAETIMAWFVGGLLGRILGYTYLVGYLGWPEVSGWLSVPIGAAIAWLAVEAKAIVPAIRYAYQWTQKPMHLVSWAERFSQAHKCLVVDCHEFKDNWCWCILNATSVGLFIGFWLIFLGFSSAIMSENCDTAVFGKFTPLFVGALFMCMYAFVSIYAILISGKFLEHMGWDRFFEKPNTGNHVRDVAIVNALSFLEFNPISVCAILFLIAVPYCITITVKEVAVWLGKIVWKTIRMVNSTKRMVVMTGAVIGLSISQIYGHNPVICGGACVLAGLAERLVFGLAGKAVRKLTAEQTA